MLKFRSLLVLAFLVVTVTSPSAQKGPKRMLLRPSVKELPRSRTPGSQSKTAQISFHYYPSPFDWNYKNLEFVFVVIAGDGTAQAVLRGPYNPAIIGVYEGTLPEATVEHFIVRAEEIIPKASEITKPYIGSCDAESFQLSVDYQRPSVSQNKRVPDACLLVMPQEIRDFVEEIRGVWKQLNQSTLAYGYVRSFPLEGDLLKSAKSNPKRFVSIRKLAPRLQAIVRNVGKQTPKFYALRQVDYEQLRASTNDPAHFYVIDNDHGYFLTDFFISRPHGLTGS